MFRDIKYPGPYFEIEKGIFLLYQIVSGISGKDINNNDNLPYSSYYKFYKMFWITNYNSLLKKVNDALKMFSNIKIRIFSCKYI